MHLIISCFECLRHALSSKYKDLTTLHIPFYFCYFWNMIIPKILSQKNIYFSQTIGLTVTDETQVAVPTESQRINILFKNVKNVRAFKKNEEVKWVRNRWN